MDFFKWVVVLTVALVSGASYYAMPKPINIEYNWSYHK